MKKPRIKKPASNGHGGARPGAGRKPGSAVKPACAMCAVLLKQLDAAEKREQALMKQLGRKDDQIGMVLESKFETVKISGEQMPQPTGPVMPLETLMDVEAHDDTEFISKVKEMTH